MANCLLLLQNNRNITEMINTHNAQLMLTITGCLHTHTYTHTIAYINVPIHTHDTYTFSDALYINIYRLTSINYCIHRHSHSLDIHIHTCNTHMINSHPIHTLPHNNTHISTYRFRVNNDIPDNTSYPMLYIQCQPTQDIM